MRTLNQELNTFNQVSIGFERLLTDLFNQKPVQSQFPKYNIVKNSETEFELILALAGYKQKDIEITVNDNHLFISSAKDKEELKEDTREYLYQGIAKRSFKFKMMLHEYTTIKGATMKDGMLIISLENIIPEEKQPQKIEIK